MTNAPLDERERRAYEANIRRAFLYEGFTHFQLWVPIWVVYLQVERGLSLAQIAILDAPFFLTQVLMEVPTGGFADRFGRRASLMVGSVMFSLAVLVFGMAETFWLILASYLLWGVATTFQSGADSALLYDSLKLAGREHDYARLQGAIFAIFPAASLVAGLIGAPLAEATSLPTPILVSAAIAGGGFFVALTMKEPPQASARLGYIANIRQGLTIAIGRPTVRYALLFGPLLGVSLMTVTIFTQPYLVGHGASIGSLGLFVVPMRVAAVLGSLLAYRIAQRLGEWPLFAAAPFIAALAFLGLAGWDSLYAFPLFAVLTFTSSLRNPVLVRYINDRIPSGQRATILSLRQLILGVLLAGIEPLVGVIAHEASLRLAFAFLAGLALAPTLPVLLLWRRAHLQEARQTEDEREEGRGQADVS